MRKFFTAVTAAALCVGVAAGVHAKTLKMAYDADPVSLDPHEQLSGGTLQLSHMIFDPLVRWTKDLGFEGRLAESWERIDEKTMRFKLREGVKFHSGNDMTSLDLVWTFDRLKKSPDFKGLFAPFEAMKVVDKNTIDLITAEPYPLVLHQATYIFAMDSKFYTGFDKNGKSKAAIVKHGDAFASTNVSGTGPFIVTSREQGVKVTFKRFDGYWDKKSPGNVSEIIMTPIKEGPTRVAALLSGDVDFIAPVPPTDLDRIEKNDKTHLVTMGGTRIITFQLNQKRVEHFKDQRVRQAIVHAINNEGIVKKIMKGFATPAGQQGPKGYAGYSSDLTPRYDLNKAKALMKEAGLEGGFTVTMMAPNNRYVNDAKIAEAVASMGGEINTSVGMDSSFIGMDVLGEFTPDAVGVLADMAINASFVCYCKCLRHGANRRHPHKVVDQFGGVSGTQSAQIEHIFSLVFQYRFHFCKGLRIASSHNVEQAIFSVCRSTPKWCINHAYAFFSQVCTNFTSRCRHRRTKIYERGA